MFPNATIDGVLAHLREEINTEMDGTEDLSESADVLILLFQYCMLREIDLYDELGKKMLTNMKRQWQDADYEGIYRHIDDPT